MIIDSHFISYGFVGEQDETAVYTTIYSKEDKIQQLDLKHFDKTIKINKRYE